MSSPGSHPTLLLVTGSLEAGGAERVLADMANYWNRKGWRIALATWQGPSSHDFYTLDQGVKRLWLNVDQSASVWDKVFAYMRRIRKLRQIMRQTRPTAVLSFIDTSNVLTLLASAGLRLRVVVSERVNGAAFASIPWQWRLLRNATYWLADVVVGQTPDAAKWISRAYCVRAVAIPNPLRELPNGEVYREPIILAVGRLTHQKGFDLLLRAFSTIRREFPGWRVVIIGAGPEQSALAALCAELDIKDSVDFRSPVKEVEAWMSRAGIVVQPSRFEGFPNVILEAMGMGAAVVSADCRSGPADIIRDGINGRLVPVENVNALSHVMAELLRQPEERARLGFEARKVRQVFRQDIVMRQWESCVFP